MEDACFDACTRRRFGMAASSLAAALLGLASNDAETKKRKRKKRCKRLGQGCKPGGKRQCCGELRCDQISFEPNAGTRCCRAEDQPCSEHRHCCDGLCCQLSGLCGPQCLI